MRRKQNNNIEEFYSIAEKDNTEESPTLSKHKLNKQKRTEKRILKTQINAQKKEENKGESTIVEEDKKGNCLSKFNLLISVLAILITFYMSKGKGVEENVVNSF